MKPGSNKLVAAVVVGNILVWYDIALFSFLAVYLSDVFFSGVGPDLALVVTFATFAVSFLVRPLGSLLIGGLADKRGRRGALVLSTSLMMLGSLMIAVMPSYAAIGNLAPLGILLARIIQGIAAGGEFGTATAILAEMDPARRGYVTSWQLVSQTLSGTMAAAAGLLLALTLSDTEIRDWGWRLAFLVGGLVGPVGLYIRWQLPDVGSSPTPQRSPVALVLRQELPRVVIGIGLVAISTAVTYVLTYIPAYATRRLGLSNALANTAVMLGFLIQLPIGLVVGRLSDRWGRMPLLTIGLAGVMFSIVPAFWLVIAVGAGGSPAPNIVVICAVAWLAAMKAIYSGALAATVADLFPRGTRATGVALSYNTSVTLFGSAAPLIVASIERQTVSSMVPAWYLLAAASLSALALLALRSVGPAERTQA